MTTKYQFAAAQPAAEAEVWLDADALGVESITRTRLTGATDTLTFTVSAADALTADAPFAYDTLLRFRRLDTDGEAETATLLFLGRVQTCARSADGEGEGQAITLLGPWDWFERTVMRQDWMGQDAVARTAPRAVLFWGDGSRLTTGAQIERCVAAARAGGCPCAAPSPGDIAAGFTPPVDEQVNISVAQAVNICLANHPHSVCWFDYSQREPVFRVASRLDLPAVTLGIGQDKDYVAVTSREDLQPPAVAVCYQKPWADGEKSGMSTVIDYAPHVEGETDGQLAARLSRAGVLWAVFDLAGASTQYQEREQSLEVERIDWEVNKNSAAWWARFCPQLNDPNITDIRISNPSATGSLPNFLLSGAVEEWMQVDVAEDTFTADAQVVTGPLMLPLEIRTEKLVFKKKTTDGHSKTYRRKTVTAHDSGDSVPEGLAAAMWAEWQQLHHDGAIAVVDAEAPVDIGPGKTLCLAGGRPEWVTMRALVKRVTESFADGVTEIEFGVPQWIDIDSRFAWYRNCRNRRASWSFNQSAGQEQGEVEETDGGAAGIIGLPGENAGANTAHVIRRVFDNPAAPVAHRVDIYANADLGGFEFATPADGEAARNVRVLEVLLPVEFGGKVTGAKRAQVLACAPYGEEVPLDIPEPTEEGGWEEISEPPVEIPEGIEFLYEADLIDGAPTIDLNDEEAQAHVHIYIAVPGEVGSGVIHWFRVPHRFIAARFPDRGMEDLSLGIVRGLHDDELSPLMARLAGVDEPPDGGPQKIYGYFTPSFGGDTNPRWGLWELESLFKADLANKRLYMDLAGYGNFKPLSADADTWDFNADANINGKNGPTLDVVTDVSWDSGTKKLTVKKRTVTLFKFGLKTVTAASPVESEIAAGGQFDVRYDQGSGQLQKSTDGGQNWGMVSGGQTVPETV